MNSATATPAASRVDVLVREVGPRDGLQSIKPPMPTGAKNRWIAALAASGLRTIEVGSFVSAKLLPQMADAAEVVKQARTLPGLTVAALAPNLRGAQDAVTAGAHHDTVVGFARNEVEVQMKNILTANCLVRLQQVQSFRQSRCAQCSGTLAAALHFRRGKDRAIR